MSPHRIMPLVAQAGQIASMTFVPAVFDDVVIGVAFIACLGTTLFLYATGHVVPDQLYGLTGIFIGYYVRNMVAAGKTTAASDVSVSVAPPSEGAQFGK